VRWPSSSTKPPLAPAIRGHARRFAGQQFSLRSLYQSILSARLGCALPTSAWKAGAAWINDGLMAIFFACRLEIKRELIVGDSRARQSSPCPALPRSGHGRAGAYLQLHQCRDWVALRGWRSGATDIAFAMGCWPCSATGASLVKIFLLALAILDDLGSILIIAMFYTADLHWSALLLPRWRPARWPP
jgi:NhaA family Na+:H+ antiporter